MSGLRVLFSCYPTAFQSPAGGEVQLLSTLEAVRALGVRADQFDPWTSRIEEYDVLHHFSLHPGGEEILRCARTRGVGIALSTIFWPDSEWWHPVDHLRGFAALADLLLPNSAVEARRLGRILGQRSQRFHVVVNGVDAAYAEPPDPAPFLACFGQRLPGPRFALCVGRFDFRKNQMALVKAMRESPIPVVFLGGVRDPEYLERCRGEAGPRTVFLDPLPPGSPLLRSAYAACAAFVMPALYETPGLAALEAAATGAPLVITREGSTRAYFGPHATYVYPLALRELRAAIERAVEGPRSDALRRHVLGRFTWERAARQTVEAYRRILSLRLARRTVAVKPAFVTAGFEAGPEVRMGGGQDFQLRLGWGGIEAAAGRPGRRMLGRAAGLYLLGEGRRLAVDGWSDGPSSLRVRLDGGVVGVLELEGGDFAGAWDAPRQGGEIREVHLELPRRGPTPSLVLRRVALEP